MHELAPIGISTYIRIELLKKTILALQKNTLAKQSRLVFFSDGPKAGDEEKVKEIRKYLHAIDGFKEVVILERQRNSRVKNNRGGIQQLLDESGRCIFMEEDIVTAPGFLQYMNDALDFYKNDPRILSITGYTPPIDLVKHDHDFFVLSRFSAWGAGFWQGKFEDVAYINKDDYKAFINDKNAVKAFVRAGGEDMPAMLESEVNGCIDAYDVKAMFHQFQTKTLTVYPKHSLVQNIGFDGSGVHCGETTRFHHDKLWGKTEGFKFDKNPQVNESIRKANFRFRSLGLKGKLVNFLKTIQSRLK
jgi:hypothetical protein